MTTPVPDWRPVYGDERVERLVLGLADLGPDRHSLPRHLPSELFERVLTRTQAEHVDGFFVAAVVEGRVEIDDQQRGRLSHVHRQSMVQALRMERALAGVTDELLRHGITAVVLKGVALANTIYPDPALRPMSDVDLYVGPDAIEDVLVLLAGLGALRAIPEVRRGHDRRFGKDVPVRLDGTEFDLHARLIRGPYGHLIAADPVIARRRAFEASGVELSGLDQPDAYLMAAITVGAADVPPRYITLRDLVELERQPEFAPATVVERANEWQVAPVLARAVRILAAHRGMEDPPQLFEWASSLSTTRRDAFLLGSYIGGGRSYRSHLASAVVLPNWRTRLAYLRNLAAPQSSYRQARHWSWLTHIRRAYSQLTRFGR